MNEKLKSRLAKIATAVLSAAGGALVYVKGMSCADLERIQHGLPSELTWPAVSGAVIALVYGWIRSGNTHA